MAVVSTRHNLATNRERKEEEGDSRRAGKSDELLDTCQAGWRSRAVVSVGLKRGGNNEGRATGAEGERCEGPRRPEAGGLSRVRKRCEGKEDGSRCEAALEWWKGRGRSRSRERGVEAGPSKVEKRELGDGGMRAAVEVGSGVGFILEVGLVDAWRESSRGSEARKGGRQPIARSGPPRFPKQNHRHAHYFYYIKSN